MNTTSLRLSAGMILLAGTLGSAGVAAAQAPPGAPARKPGKLAGKIIADKDGKPIPGAVVIARCGPDGEHEFITRTDHDGAYEFKNIPADDTNCLVRGEVSLGPGKRGCQTGSAKKDLGRSAGLGAGGFQSAASQG